MCLAVMAKWQADADDGEAHEVAMPAAPGSPNGLLNEVEGLAFLAAHGVAPAPYRHVQDADAAVAAWHELGRQAVLKIVSRDLPHKSDVGGVRVGLRNEEEVREACAAIEASVAQHAPQARREGMLVARKLSPRLEVMLGARCDESFGPLVVLGLGGVAVELDAHTLVLTAPTTPARVRDRLDRLGVLKRLQAWRGNAAIAPDALIDTVVCFAALAASLGPRLRTMEINPLMVMPDGVAAADAVIDVAP